MNQVDPEQFDDPSLKDAIRRAVPAERAPVALRQRIEGTLTSGASAGMMSWLRYRPFTYGIAAAAILVIGFGIQSGYLPLPWQSKSSQEQIHLGMRPSLPATLIAAMVETHDRCCAKPDHHQLPGDDFSAIAKTFQAQLNRPTIARNLGEPGWTFKGAGLCRVGQIKSGHLVFEHGDEHVSVFSLPVSDSYCEPEGSNYQLVAQNHPLAGFVHGGGLFCVVGYCPDGDLTVKDVVRLRDELEAPAAHAACDQLLEVIAEADAK